MSANANAALEVKEVGEPGAGVPRAEGAIVVLGLGNLLRRDEGLGIRALECLQKRDCLPEQVRLVDGGTLGLELLAHVEDAERLLVLDAALTEGPPGTLLRVAGDAVPAYFGMRTSPHEIGLADLLAVARLRGAEPCEVVVLGMQPEAIELGWELSASVAAQLDALVTAAVDELARWGCAPEPHTAERELASASRPA
jgi:hydrogenase maturation protease